MLTVIDDDMCLYFFFLLFFFFFSVYPPHSMDGAEYAWDLDDPTLTGFMSSYAPVPGHLRKRKALVGEDEQSEEVAELDGDEDVAGNEEDPGVENESLLEQDPSDEVLVRAPNKQKSVDPSAVSAPRNRRRLVKGGVHVALQGQGASISRETALNIPVSSWLSFSFFFSLPTIFCVINVVNQWVCYEFFSYLSCFYMSASSCIFNPVCCSCRMILFPTMFSTCPVV